MEPFYDSQGITIYHGDCREILPQLEPVGVVLTDPPYNVGVDYGDGTDDSKSMEAFVSWVGEWFPECRRLAETVLVCGQARLPQYALVEPWKWLLCWWKPAAMGRSPVGFCNWEPVAMWGKGTRSGNDVVRAPIIPDGELSRHPCPKPLAWAIGFLTLLSEGVVLDPFMGSGTTLRAAKDLHRKAIGIEIEEKYCEYAAKRLGQGVLDLG